MLLRINLLWLAAVTIAWLSLVEGAIAETCIPLKVIGGEGALQRKEVSVPSVPFVPFVPFVRINNNWNTDFAVPGGKVFNHYVATITPEGNVTYGMEMNLKYSDRDVDNFFNKTIDIKKGQQFKILATSRPDNAPYEVNVLVGGVENATGTYYTLLVEACYGEPDAIPGIDDVTVLPEYRRLTPTDSATVPRSTASTQESSTARQEEDVTEIEIYRDSDRPAPASSPSRSVPRQDVPRDSDVRRAD
jgi:hypothetical protein